jgi:hypothetical protein
MNKKWALEKQAQNFWEILLSSGLSDGHCKSYDPLTIEPTEGGYNFLSYVFDHDDGTRIRFFETLDEGQEWLLESFGDWLLDHSCCERESGNGTR